MKLKNLVLGAAIATFTLLLTGCGRTSVNLNDYVTVNYEGYNTVGVAGYEFDCEKMIEDNPKAFGLSKDHSNDDTLEVLFDISCYIDGRLDKMEDLSNGDTINFKWDISNEEALKENYPISIKYSDITVNVEGLDEAESFDPFANIKVTFSGIAPNGTVSIDSNGKGELEDLIYTADVNDGLSNGDKVKVKVNAFGGNLNEYCLKYGKIPSTTEKEYTVEGLASYAMSLDKIPEEVLDKMDNHAQDTFKAHVASNWNDTESLKKITLIGNYFVYPKDSIKVSTQNYLYFVYKIDAENMDDKEKKGQTFSYYYYSYFEDIMILEDGTCSYDLNKMTVPYGSSFFGSVSGEAFSTGEHYYMGYKDLDSLFNKQITSKIGQYSYESTVEEK